MPHAAPLSLGWFSLCLRAQHYEQTVAWYRGLGFIEVGGKLEHGYVVLANAATTITIMRFLQANLLCFRGADVVALAAALGERGVTVYHQGGTDPTSPDAAKLAGPRRYDPSAWPAEFHTDAHGEPLAVTGAGDFSVDDPSGHALYFDSVPVERVRFDAGERFATAAQTGVLASGQPDLGRFVLRLRVDDLAASRDFYARLGLTVVADQPERGYVELRDHLPVPCTIGLDANAPGDVLSFACDDLAAVPAAAAEAEPQPDGALVARLRDPEGNQVVLRQPPAGAA